MAKPIAMAIGTNTDLLVKARNNSTTKRRKFREDRHKKHADENLVKNSSV
jgi:hypothetical protein